MITLKPVTEQEKKLLWNINQKYLYEMSQYYPEDLDEEGNLHYGYFDAYFTEPERKAYLIYHEKCLAGFAMLNPYSYIGGKPDFVLAEFCVFPSYRGQHIATKAFEWIMANHPGRWEIKYNESNPGAKSLWQKVTKKYDPVVHRINDEETVLEFSNGQAAAGNCDNNIRNSLVSGNCGGRLVCVASVNGHRNCRIESTAP